MTLIKILQYVFSNEALELFSTISAYAPDPKPEPYPEPMLGYRARR